MMDLLVHHYNFPPLLPPPQVQDFNLTEMANHIGPNFNLKKKGQKVEIDQYQSIIIEYVLMNI